MQICLSSNQTARRIVWSVARCRAVDPGRLRSSLKQCIVAWAGARLRRCAIPSTAACDFSGWLVLLNFPRRALPGLWPGLRASVPLIGARAHRGPPPGPTRAAPRRQFLFPPSTLILCFSYQVPTYCRKVLARYPEETAIIIFFFSLLDCESIHGSARRQVLKPV